MRTLLLLTLFISTVFGAAAQKGQLAGKVIDAKTAEELMGATIVIDGTTTATITDFSGDYVLPNINPGTYTIKCLLISYEPAVATQVVIKSGETTKLNLQMKPVELDLQEVNVVAKVNRSSETMLLMEQKSSVKLTEAIGAQQLSVQGVSDAATAATKMTGINKQSSSKTIFIRGLGDRYNATTLNGLPLPSNNAELKNIDLEIFSTEVIEYVSVEKAFTPQMYGDFAGGTINIQSKKFSGQPFMEVSAKIGANGNVMSASEFYLGDGASKTGFENFSQPSTLATYDFENQLDPIKTAGTPEGGLSLSGGRSFHIGESKLNLFATGSYENTYGYSEEIKRKVNGSNIVRKELMGDKYSLSTQTIGMLNLNLDREKSSYYINSLYSNFSDHEISNLRGYIIDVAEDGAYMRRTEFERTQLMVNQFLGRNDLSKRTTLNYGIAYNLVNNVIPDRRDNILDGTDSQYKIVANNDKGNNKRYFHEMDESELAGNLSLAHKIGEPYNGKEHRGIITVGYSGRIKKHEFHSDQYNTEIRTAGREVLVDVMGMDAYFNNENMQKDYFALSKMPSTYSGNLLLQGGFGMIEYALGSKWDLLAGLRFEQVYQEIEFNTIIKKGSEFFQEYKPMPSLSMKYAVTPKANLRMAFSSTYTLPQFKETAPFLFEGITDATEGNPYLYPSTDYNGELKWEYFPKTSELISVSLFGKYIIDPINKFVKASASNEFTYANTGDWAQIIGTELELRKDIYSTEIQGGSQKLFVNINATFMKTMQELDKEKILEESENSVSVNFNKAEEELEGAAPIIGNFNLGHQINWEKGTSLTNSLVYNYVSDNITLIGYQSLGNQVEQEVHSLDFIIKYATKKVGVKFIAKNLLNHDLERYQENTSQSFLVDSRNKGTKFNIELSYRF